MCECPCVTVGVIGVGVCVGVVDTRFVCGVVVVAHPSVCCVVRADISGVYIDFMLIWMMRVMSVFVSLRILVTLVM